MKRSIDSIDRLSVKQITLESKYGSVKLSVGNDGKINFTQLNKLETGSFSIDLKNEKISTKKIEFIKDNSSFTSSLNIGSAGSSNSSDAKFDPSTGRLIEDFLPGDFKNIRDNALEAIGKFEPSGPLKDTSLNQNLLNNIIKGVTAHDKFDITGKLPQENIHDSILDNIVKGVTAHEKFDADGRLPIINIHTDVVADIVKGVTAHEKFDADGRLPIINIHTDVVTDIVKGVTAHGKFDTDGRLSNTNIKQNLLDDVVKGVTAHDDVANLDFSLDNSNPDIPAIRMSRGSRGFATTTFSKNHIGLSNVDNKSSLAIRNEITVDTTTGKLIGIGTADIIVNNENTFADTRFTTVQSSANTANTLSNTIEGRFSGGLLKVTSAAADLRNSNISIAQASTGEITLTLGGSIPSIAINPLSTTTFTNVQTAANTANTLSNSIEGRFSDGKLLETNLQAITVTKITNGNSAHSDLNSADVSIDTSGKIQFNRGGSRGSSTGATLTKSHIGLPLAENKSAATIRAEITIDNNGAIQGIGTGIGTVINNNSLGISQASNGTITITRGGTLTSLTANPLSTTTFTTVQSTANTANTLSNTIESRFSNGKIKSSNLSSDDDGFKFTSSNKLKIGNNNATIATTSTTTSLYDSESDFEIITGSTGTPDIAILKAQKAGDLVIGQINFKGWDGAQSEFILNGQTVASNRDRFSPRSTIQASTDAFGGGRIDFLTATGAVYNAFMIPAETPTSPVVRMRIAANGNIGIGTTSPTQDLDINGTMRLRSLVAGTSTGFGRNTTTGDITALTSDQRLKKDINTITGSLNSVCNLRGVTYKWDDTRFNNFIIDDIEKEKIQIGLIAQEVEAVLPELVYNNGVEDLKAVRYAEIVAVLIEAVKELKQKNEQTESSLLQLIIKLSGSNII